MLTRPVPASNLHCRSAAVLPYTMSKRHVCDVLLVLKQFVLFTRRQSPGTCRRREVNTQTLHVASLRCGGRWEAMLLMVCPVSFYSVVNSCSCHAGSSACHWHDSRGDRTCLFNPTCAFLQCLCVVRALYRRSAQQSTSVSPSSNCTLCQRLQPPAPDLQWTCTLFFFLLIVFCNI